MNETTKYGLDAIKRWVWSGFYSPTDVDEMIDDVLGNDSDEVLLRAAVGSEFKKKAATEATWPSVTDCDRLDQAFDELNAHGIIALQNTGYEMSDGVTEVAEVLEERDTSDVRGYCFYHWQDVEGAMKGEELLIAFCDIDSDDKVEKALVGRTIKDVFERFGLNVKWNGDPETRLGVEIDWKRRGP
jgi:hypothetical protein